MSTQHGVNICFAYCLYSVLSVKAVVAAFNQEKPLVIRDYEPSNGPSFQALPRTVSWQNGASGVRVSLLVALVELKPELALCLHPRKMEANVLRRKPWRRRIFAHTTCLAVIRRMKIRIAAVREANSTGNSTIQPGKPFRMYIIDSLFGFIGKAKLANNYYNREGVKFLYTFTIYISQSLLSVMRKGYCL